MLTAVAEVERFKKRCEVLTATADELKYANIVPGLRAIEARVRTMSRVDAEAIEKIIADIVGPVAPGSHLYKGYRGVSRWL